MTYRPKTDGRWRKTCCSIGVLSREYRSFVVVDSETMELQIKQIKQNEYFFSSTITKNYQKFFETKNAAVRSIQKSRQGLLPALILDSFVKRL